MHPTLIDAAVCLNVAKRKLALVTSLSPLMLLRHSTIPHPLELSLRPSGSDGPPLAFDPYPTSRCTTTYMTTPPP